MKKIKLPVINSLKKPILLIITLFSCILSFSQKKHINDIILVDATQLKNEKNIAQPIVFNKETNEWTIEPNEHDVFIFKVINEVNLEDIPSIYKLIPLDSFIDDSVDRYEKFNGKKPEAPYFGGTHIETMAYKKLYLKVKDNKDRYYKVLIRYEWKIGN
ncbi:hypothetical protein AV926_06345 [Myroides marinus]|uniref:Uncharacterized protein n=1 Tax=Myroides marinus TaxID=703342 RepID=A0A165RJZ8_9FLAO|nr:hypothetical protein [Myroides marinus]KZE82852.1 hypothetical protein AV926_06345 [Myroides marinus]